MNTPNQHEGLESKVDTLIVIAATVKQALNRRTAIVTAAIAFPLIVGAALLFMQVMGTRDNNRLVRNNQSIANQAYIQALVNNRDFLQYRKDFAQTRDCPVEYFRELVIATRTGEDITAVLPPCETIDTSAIDAQIAEVNRKIAAVGK